MHALLQACAIVRTPIVMIDQSIQASNVNYQRFLDETKNCTRSG